MPSPVPLILFDDDRPGLTPLTDLRAAFMLRTGAMTTLERWGAIAPSLGLSLHAAHAPRRLRDLTLESPTVPKGELRFGADVLFVNARCVLLPPGLDRLQTGSALTAATNAGAKPTIVAARLSASDAPAFLESLNLPPNIKADETADARLLQRPWDIIRHRDACLDADLAHLSESVHASPVRKHGAAPDRPGVTLINAAAVHIHPCARVSPTVTLDAELGPIVIDENAVLRPGVIIVGPVYIGKHSTVLERALIKAHTAVGPVCKVAGEVGGTIFQGYANKGHDGHLGDSWVGEWANFGAGTTNSNLLNTYGEVTAALALPGASRERTGLQYLGCIVGDHTKFAINTRIMTGSIFGTGCMVATVAAPPTCVPAFSWLTDERTQPYRFSKFLEVAKAVMARRKIVPSEAYIAAMEALAGTR